MEAWPFDSTNRSRFSHFGSSGSYRRNSCHRQYVTGARPIGAPGCPLLACCTASIARVRIVLMHSVSSCVPVTTACSLTAMRCALLPGNNSATARVIPPACPTQLEFPGQKGFQIRIECTNFLRTNVAGSVKNGENVRKARELEEQPHYLLQQLQVTFFALRRPRGFLDILKELPEVFFFGCIHSGEANPHSPGSRAASDHAVQRETFDPDLATRDP